MVILPGAHGSLFRLFPNKENRFLLQNQQFNRNLTNYRHTQGSKYYVVIHLRARFENGCLVNSTPAFEKGSH